MFTAKTHNAKAEKIGVCYSSTNIISTHLFNQPSCPNTSLFYLCSNVVDFSKIFLGLLEDSRGVAPINPRVNSNYAVFAPITFQGGQHCAMWHSVTRDDLSMLACQVPCWPHCKPQTVSLLHVQKTWSLQIGAPVLCAKNRCNGYLRGPVIHFRGVYLPAQYILTSIKLNDFNGSCQCHLYVDLAWLRHCIIMIIIIIIWLLIVYWASLAWCLRCISITNGQGIIIAIITNVCGQHLAIIYLEIERCESFILQAFIIIHLIHTFSIFNFYIKCLSVVF